MADGKTRILESSLNVFLAKGYEAASMMDLVRASGLSKGAFYHYFPSKEVLFRAIVDHVFFDYFRDGRGEPDDLPAVVEAQWKDYCALLDDLSDRIDDIALYYRFLFTVFAMFPDLKDAAGRKADEARRRLEDGFRRYQDLGKIDAALDPRLLADQIVALIEGQGMLLALQSGEQRAERFRELTETFLGLVVKA